MNAAKNSFWRVARPALLCAAAVLAATSCFVKSENIGDFGHDTIVSRLTGTSEPREPGGAVFATLTKDDYRASLRRVIVTYDTWISLAQTDPRPLFSDAQIADFALVLERELAGLQPNQRIEFRFRETFRNLEVEVELYKEGELLVFHFEKLAEDSNQPVELYSLTTDTATLTPQVGQTIEFLAQGTLLREPVRPEIVINARAQQQKIDLITTAQQNGRISEEAEETLLEIAADAPSIEIEAFRQHIRKRQTLRKAVRQGLFNAEDFRSRMERLESGLRRLGSRDTADPDRETRTREAQLLMIRSAQRDRFIARSEMEHLESLVEGDPAPSMVQLMTFLDKRKTLQQARDQELLTEEEFRLKVERLAKELSR